MKISIAAGIYILQHIGILVIKSVGLIFEVVLFFFFLMRDPRCFKWSRYFTKHMYSYLVKNHIWINKSKMNKKGMIKVMLLSLLSTGCVNIIMIFKKIFLSFFFLQQYLETLAWFAKSKVYFSDSLLVRLRAELIFPFILGIWPPDWDILPSFSGDQV